MEAHLSRHRAFSAELLGRFLTLAAWVLVGLAVLAAAFDDGSLSLTLFLVSFFAALAGFVFSLRAFRRGHGGGWVVALASALVLAEIALVALFFYWLAHTAPFD